MDSHLEKEADILDQQKTEEELVQFEVEEDLPELVRIERLLLNGHPVQKISALHGLEPALVVVGVSGLEANLSKLTPLLKALLGDMSKMEAEHGAGWEVEEAVVTALYRLVCAQERPKANKDANSLGRWKAHLNALNLPNVAMGSGADNSYFHLELPTSPYDEKINMTVKERTKAAESMSSIASLANAPQMSLKRVDSRGSGQISTPGSRPTRNLLSGGQIVRHIFPLMYQLLDTKIEKESLWTLLLMFRETLVRVPLDVVKREIVPYAIAKGDVSQPPFQRMVCCHLLGQIAEHKLLSTEEIEASSGANKASMSFMSVAMALCQDTDFEVRTCMCRQLNHIARNAGELLAVSRVLPEMVELLQDEELEVKLAAFEAIVDVLDFLPSQACEEDVLPVLQEFCALEDSAPSNDDIVPILARCFGTMMHKLWRGGLIRPDNIGSFVDRYNEFVRGPKVETRKSCASNLGSVARVVGAPQYAQYLDETLRLMTQDVYAEVRIEVAASLRDVANILGKQRVMRFLKDAVIQLLRDDNTDVQVAMMSNIPHLLSFFAVVDSEQKMAAFGSTLSAILHHESCIQKPQYWRQQLQFVSCLWCFPLYFSSMQIFEQVVPVLVTYLANSAQPVRTEAAKSLCWLLRSNEHSSQRKEIMSIMMDMLRSTQHHSRMLFIHICCFILQYFSNSFFKKHFLESVLELLDDPVEIVRVKALTLLPLLRHTLSFPADASALDKITQAASKMKICPQASQGVRDIASECSDQLAILDSADVEKRKNILFDAARSVLYISPVSYSKRSISAVLCQVERCLPEDFNQKKIDEEEAMRKKDEFEADQIKKQQAEERRQEMFARTAKQMVEEGNKSRQTSMELNKNRQRYGSSGNQRVGHPSKFGSGQISQQKVLGDAGFNAVQSLASKLDMLGSGDGSIAQNHAVAPAGNKKPGSFHAGMGSSSLNSGIMARNGRVQVAQVSQSQRNPHHHQGKGIMKSSLAVGMASSAMHKHSDGMQQVPFRKYSGDSKEKFASGGKTTLPRTISGAAARSLSSRSAPSTRGGCSYKALPSCTNTNRQSGVGGGATNGFSREVSPTLPQFSPVQGTVGTTRNKIGRVSVDSSGSNSTTNKHGGGKGVANRAATHKYGQRKPSI